MGSTLGTSPRALSPLAAGQNSLGFLAEVAIALREQEDFETQCQIPPPVASAPPVLSSTAPANEPKRKRLAAENESQSVGEEEAPMRPVKRTRTRRLKVGVQPPTPTASSRRCTRAQVAFSLRRVAPGPSQPPATSAPANENDRGKSAAKNCNSKPKSKQANSLSPFKRKQMRALKTVEEMVEQFEKREKRAEDWAKQYRKIGRAIRPEYDFWREEQLEWIMSAAIHYENDWGKITIGYQKVFPEAKPRTKHSIYSKWARQWEREEKLRHEDLSKTPNRPGHDRMAPPVKRKISEDKRRMMERALEIVRSKQKP